MAHGIAQLYTSKLCGIVVPRKELAKLGKRRNTTLTHEERGYLSNPIRGESLSFDEALELFIENRKQRQARDATLVHYRQGLHTLKLALLELGLPTEPSEVTEEVLFEKVIPYWRSKRLKQTTINTKLKDVRAFFNFLYKKDYILENPVQDLKIKEGVIEQIIPFTDEQVKKLFKACDMTTFMGVRDYTLMMYLLDTGVRIKEAQQTDVHDIDWRENYILIRAPKGYRQRKVPISDQLKTALRRWINIRGNVVTTDALFISVDENRLSIGHMQKRIRELGQLAGVTGVRVSPHTFRHTFAKMSIMNGAGVFELQKILGHETLEMVRRYVNMFSDDVREAHEKFSPLKNLHLRE